nr:acetylglutamate kinase [bacterium]
MVNITNQERACVLIEALPYIQQFYGKTIVIKYGGNAMTQPGLVRAILEDITLLKYVGVNPVVVHGGGPDINRMLGKLEIPAQFHQGLRITDGATMEVVQMVLTGKVNKDIAATLGCMGAKAIGLCGKDAGLIHCKKKPAKDGVDLGYVGEITSINTRLLEMLAGDEYVPVIAPVGVGEDGESYNVNADTAAGEIAVALKAEKLVFLTDIDGVRANPDDPSTLMKALTVSQVRDNIASGVITGGMIPKVQSCVDAVERGVERVHIVNGTVQHAILLEMLTRGGIGTMVHRDGTEGDR